MNHCIMIIIESVSHSGTGVLTVTSGSGYNIWLSGYTFAPGANTTAAGDPDKDGATNLLEYVLNRNPSASDAPIVPQLDASGSNFVFTFTRRTDSATGTTQVPGVENSIFL